MSENDKRVTFKDVLSRPNKFSSVEIANAAIFDSFNNKNQLDFDVLRSKLNEIAQKSATMILTIPKLLKVATPLILLPFIQKVLTWLPVKFWELCQIIPGSINFSRC
jgi:hypothetical protein